MKNSYKTSILIVALVLIALAGSAFARVRTVTLRVQGMTCEMCAASLEPELKSTSGVLDAKVFFKKGTAWIKYDDAKITLAGLRKVIKDTGFRAVAKR